MEEQKDLPKPLTDLPLPEKEIPAYVPPPAGGSNVLKSKFLWGFVAVSFLAAFLIGGFVLGKNTTKQSPTPTVAQTPTPTPDPPAGWQTYISPCGFSLKYPTTWTAKKYFNVDSNSQCAAVMDENFKLIPNSDGVEGFYMYVSKIPVGTVTNAIVITTPQDYVDVQKSYVQPTPNINVENKTFGNLSGLEFDSVGQGNYREFTFKNGSYIYTFLWLADYSNTYKQNIETIISSFKFTQ